MPSFDDALKSEILKEIESFVKQEKTYQSYTLFMEELSLWLQKKAK